MPHWETSRVIPAQGFVPPCLPTAGTRVPDGPNWVHEIKHDGYRLMVRRTADKSVRIYTRRGVDWTHRFPLIVEAALRLKARSLHLDGEGVVCNAKGVAVFDQLHSKVNDHHAHLFAFDLIELDGEDLRPLPLEARKGKLERLLRRSSHGIVLNEHIEGDGDAIFKHACRMKLEGIVSKRRDLSYRSGRVKSWLKVKNPKSPAVLRIEDGTF
jgi:bifunctional non-homologous end joining protein LigD